MQIMQRDADLARLRELLGGMPGEQSAATAPQLASELPFRVVGTIKMGGIVPEPSFGFTHHADSVLTCESQ